MILLREVKPADIDRLMRLARRLNTLNLPADRDRLRAIIARSQDSFGERLSSIKDREYVFVMIDPEVDRLIGSCMIIAQHGTYERPSVYFDVRREQTYSTTLDRHFVHQILQLTFDYDGPTEIGGLILDPAYRGHTYKLGKLLSFVRFLYMGMHREWFRQEVVAELLPPLNPDGSSLLWDAIGYNFTGLDYMTADKISRENIEFVRSLFPSSPIYTAMLPEHVRALIGQVGTQTRPVEKMLQSIGFRYNDKIDPFDGGPTLAARADQCAPIIRTQRLTHAGALPDDQEAEGYALIGFEYDDHEVRFRAAFVEYAHTLDGALIRGVALDKLQLQPGDTIGFLPLTGGGLSALY